MAPANILSMSAWLAWDFELKLFVQKCLLSWSEQTPLCVLEYPSDVDRNKNTATFLWDLKGVKTAQ